MQKGEINIAPVETSVPEREYIICSPIKSIYTMVLYLHIILYYRRVPDDFLYYFFFFDKIIARIQQ